MTAAGLIADLRARGITLDPRGDRLRFRPASAVTAGEVEALRHHKAEILRLLEAEPWLYVPKPDPETVREVLGAAPTPADLEALHHELACALRDLRDRWAGRQPQPGTIIVRGRPLVDWLRLDDVVAIIRTHGGGAR